MRKHLAALAIPFLGFVALSAPSAIAAGTTTVHLDVDLGGAAPIADCNVKVSNGSDGADVLDAAVAKGCIDSYRSTTHPQFGELITCINDICQTPDETLNAMYWAISLDGASASTGVSDMSFPSSGDTLGFSYTTWLTFLAG